MGVRILQFIETPYVSTIDILKNYQLYSDIEFIVLYNATYDLDPIALELQGLGYIFDGNTIV